MLLPRYKILFLVCLHDSLAVPVAWFSSYWLRFNLESIPQPMWEQALYLLPLLVVVHSIVNWQFGLYRGAWRFASVTDVANILKSAIVSLGVTVTLLFFTKHLPVMPRSIFPIFILLHVSIMCGSRFIFRWAKDYRKLFQTGKKVLVVGAGAAADSLVRDLWREKGGNLRVVAFVDDNLDRVGRELQGIPIVGQTADIRKIIPRYGIELVIVAIKSAQPQLVRNLLATCEDLDVPLRILPSLNDFTAGRISIDAFREISIEDILGRSQVLLDWDKIRDVMNEHKVLVSGGGGSIGSELCRQVANLKPKELVIVESCEYNLYRIEQELIKAFPTVTIFPYLCDVFDHVAVDIIMQRHRPQTIFHAAAYKHVPLLEHQIRAAVRNNILGTCVIADAAQRYHADRFVLISTDKAVNPTNIMGATKRIAEIYCQNGACASQTKFVTVRFGNVLDSAGSVVPLFREQIAKGGPVTVTHPEITRYFMSIPEAARLILQAAVIANGGEILVLDMGEPVKIRHLAEQMIQLAGYRVSDIPIDYIGLRPGEKLFEELFHPCEKLSHTSHKKIFKSESRVVNQDNIINIIRQIREASEKNDTQQLLKLVQALTPEFAHEGSYDILEKAELVS